MVDRPYQAILEDLIRRDMGKLTTNDIRNNYRNGRYANISEEYLKWVVGRK